MKHATSTIVRIHEPKEASALLSRGQKLFNKLIKKIDADRKQLMAWQTMIPLYQQKYADEFSPLLQTFNDLRESAKTLAKEAKQQEEAKNVSQSIREVYRKLASFLHPDREPDEQERTRKTALMQRVNVAYDKQDLLQLLELQLEIEQIDQASINTLSEDRLKYYNKVLTEQSVELQQEIHAVEMSFKMRFNVMDNDVLSPASALNSLQNDVCDIQADITTIKDDLVSFQDVKNIKTWLKSYRLPPKNLFDDNAFMDMGGCVFLIQG
jgi:hypothetical protein